MKQDRELERVHWSEAGMDAYAEAEALLCRCDPDDGLCTCGWDDPDSLAMLRIERMEDHE